MIEGIKSYVPAEGKQVANSNYLIVNSKLFDPDDDTSLFEFIPGDTVSVKNESNGSGEEMIIADSLIKSAVPNRKLYSLKYTIVSQDGKLSDVQLASFTSEIEELKHEFLNSKEKFYHPAILRWFKLP
jgi:hypothetical protein